MVLRAGHGYPATVCVVSTNTSRFQVKKRLPEFSAGRAFKHHIMSAIRPKAGTTMILAGVPIIVAVAFSITSHDARASVTEASGHDVTVSDVTAVAVPAGDADQSAGTTSLVALAVEPDGPGRRDGDKKDGDKKDHRDDHKSKEPTHKPTKPTETKTTAPPTKPPVTTPPPVQPTQTELPVTGGREVSLAVAGAALVLIGALLLLLRRLARDG